MNNDIIVNFEDNKDIEIKLENKTYLNLQNKTITPTPEEQIITSDSGYDGLKEVTIKAIILQSKNASPSSNQQEIEPDENYNGLSKVTIRAMHLELFNITPRTYNQTLTPSQDYDAIGRVVINKVTADIDSNIVAENIKSGVTILGVEGTYDTPAYEGSYEITQNGTYATSGKKMTQDLVVNLSSDNDLDKLLLKTITSYSVPNGVTVIPDYLFRNISSLVSINFNQVTEIKQYAFQGTSLSGELDITNIVSIGQYAFQNTKITKVVSSTQSQKTLGQYAFANIATLQEVKIPYIERYSGQNIFLSCPITKATVGGFLPTYIFQYNRSLTTVILENNFSTSSSFNSTEPFYGNTQTCDFYFKGSLLDWFSIGSFSAHNYFCTGTFYLKDDNGDTEMDGVRYSALESVNVPSSVTTLKAYQLQSIASLISIGVHSDITNIPNGWCNNCINLNGLYLFANQVVTLSNINGVPATNQHHLTVYVPASLVTSYQTATNWSTLYNNGYVTFYGMAD